MSMSYGDWFDHGMVSDCCNASVYLNGICSSCKDHCTAVEENEPEIMDAHRDAGMIPGDFIS